MIKQEFLDDCLIKIATMQPKEFIEYVYSMGSYDGRMEEIRAFGQSIKKVFEPETKTTVDSLIDTAEKVRREQEKQ